MQSARDPVPLAVLLERERAAMSCTPVQIRLALHRAGLLETVEAIVAADPEAAIVWEYATVILRSSPLIDALAAPPFTPELIDDLFRAAALI